jgi:hypothetical protein
MRSNSTFAAFVSLLLAVAAMVQGVSGKWLYLGAAVFTVALDVIRRDDHQFLSRGVHDLAQP